MLPSLLFPTFFCILVQCINAANQSEPVLNNQLVYDFPAKSTLTAKPFTYHATTKQLEDMQALLKLSKLPSPFYEGTQRKFGITSAWMTAAKARWESPSFIPKWRASENKLNAIPQWITKINGFDIHFAAMFSQNPKATPLLLLHGWPGSWTEFQYILPELAKTGLFHIVVPSHPGYTHSSGPPKDREISQSDVTDVFDKLMVGLGYGTENGGYIAQGGDTGSLYSRLLLKNYASCKAAHLNLIAIPPPANGSGLLTPAEQSGVDRGLKFIEEGMGYYEEQRTRPSTISHALASSPLALLAWVGEKFLEWSDTDPTVDEILEILTLWWVTETAPRAIYPYRKLGKNLADFVFTEQQTKPFGYSWFPKELYATPRSWVAKQGNLVFFKEHTSGGHFAAFEKPKELAEDLVAFKKVLEQKGVF